MSAKLKISNANGKWQAFLIPHYLSNHTWDRLYFVHQKFFSAMSIKCQLDKNDWEDGKKSKSEIYLHSFVRLSSTGTHFFFCWTPGTERRLLWAILKFALQVASSCPMIQKSILIIHILYNIFKKCDLSAVPTHAFDVLRHNDIRFWNICSRPWQGRVSN